MDRTTVINSAGCHMTTSDATVETLFFSHNKKIQYLPEDFSEMFPNLVIIMAQECSIKTVSKQNFHNLTKLRGLSLRGNQIELIERGTFDELVSLEYLSLRTLIYWQSNLDNPTFLSNFIDFTFADNNRIRLLNSRVFDGLNLLKNVQLGGNVCINESFITAQRIILMSGIVDRKCGYPETSIDEVCFAKLTLKLQEIQALSNELQKKGHKITEKNQKIRELEDKVKVLSNLNNW